MFLQVLGWFNVYTDTDGSYFLYSSVSGKYFQNYFIENFYFQNSGKISLENYF